MAPTFEKLGYDVDQARFHVGYSILNIGGINRTFGNEVYLVGSEWADSSPNRQLFGLRGRVVCELGTRTMSSVADLNSWIYDTSLPGYEMKCEPLARERKYGIQVEPIDHNAFSTHFAVRADGSVVDLGREEAP